MAKADMHVTVSIPAVPEISFARPNDKRVEWQVYVGGVVKLRKLNSGVVEIATLDSDEWREA